jgi:hypothetical protein
VQSPARPLHGNRGIDIDRVDDHGWIDASRTQTLARLAFNVGCNRIAGSFKTFFDRFSLREAAGESRNADVSPTGFFIRR